MEALERPRSPSARASSLTRGVLVTVFLSSVVAVVNVLQLCTLLILPFSRDTYARANVAIVRQALGSVAGLAERLHRLRVVATGAPLPRGENAIVLVNHQSTIDINCVFSFAWRAGRLGDLRWFAKAPLKNLPGIGWSLRFLDTVFVHRSWERDEATSARAFERMNRHPRPFWLLLFPEGGRRTPAREAQSRARAAELGQAPLTHLLAPRTRGFVATVGALRPRTQAVYDLTIGFPGGVPTLPDLLAGRVRRVHLHVERFPVAELPVDEPGLESWLHARWRAKDALLEHFSTHGRFTPEAS